MSKSVVLWQNTFQSTCVRARTCACVWHLISYIHLICLPHVLKLLTITVAPIAAHGVCIFAVIGMDALFSFCRCCVAVRGGRVDFPPNIRRWARVRKVLHAYARRWGDRVRQSSPHLSPTTFPYEKGSESIFQKGYVCIVYCIEVN